MSPRPSTAEPSVTTATPCEVQVYVWASDGSAAIAWHTLATPGVYAIERSRALASGAVEATASFPPSCRAKTSSSVTSSARIEAPLLPFVPRDDRPCVPAAQRLKPGRSARAPRRRPAGPRQIVYRFTRLHIHRVRLRTGDPRK